MFQKRIKEGRDILMHEMIYPILQGYDSLMLKSDLTIVGGDQLFNEMLGRFFQEKHGQPAQVIITTKITPGIDGREKQSKSLGNYVGLSHSPRDKFGRIMSIPDNLIADYFTVYTTVPADELESIKINVSNEPMRFKKNLAYEIVKRYHGEAIASQELEWFKSTFSDRREPDDIPVVEISCAHETGLSLLRKCLPEKSNSELRRLIEQGAAALNSKRIETPYATIPIPETGVVKVGKRTWIRIVAKL